MTASWFFLSTLIILNCPCKLLISQITFCITIQDDAISCNIALYSHRAMECQLKCLWYNQQVNEDSLLTQHRRCTQANTTADSRCLHAFHYTLSRKATGWTKRHRKCTVCDSRNIHAVFLSFEGGWDRFLFVLSKLVTDPLTNFSKSTGYVGYRFITVVKMLCYKSEGHWFDPSCQWIFRWHKFLPIALWPWGRISL